MANSITTHRTPAAPEEILVTAVQFFTSERFSTTSQAPRNVTFTGKPPFPCGMMILMLLGYLFFIIPGLIIQFMLVRKFYKLHNLVVTVTPGSPDNEVSINYPSWASSQVKRFLSALPPSTALTV